MKRPCALILLLLMMAFTEAKGQTWQEVYEELTDLGSDDGEDTDALEDSYELLEQLAGHPIDLNKASREDLEQLPFLTAQQVMELQEYLYRYGPMRSLGELRMVRSLDYHQLRLLPYFVFVTGEEEDSLATHYRPPIKQTLSATLRVPFYQRAGDRNGYLGYPYRHTLRYELKRGDRLRIGLTAAQDAGEPFFASGNSWGYDTYNYYLQVRQWGRLDNLVVGKYRVSAGMGLVLGQTFQLGKLATLQSQGRQPTTLRPHSSRSVADYLQGAAATISLLRGSRRMADVPQLHLTAFMSYRPVDATLNDDGAAQTIVASGYHRTPTEMNKKGNTHLTTAGTHVAYRQGAFRLGATAVYTHSDRRLEPLSSLFRRHYARGADFFNASLDYAYTHHRMAFSGETALDGHGHIATMNTASLRATDRLSLMLLQRFYSYRYATLHGHAFGRGGQRVQNESGLYLGFTWQPLASWQLQGYADYAHYPWARYLVSQTSDDVDLLLQASWHNRHWTLTARHHTRLGQRDNDDKTALTHNNDHRERLSATWQGGPWTLKTQLDLSRHEYKQNDGGWLVSQQAVYSRPAFTVSAMAAYFDTDSYQSRIYVYERQLQHEFYFPTYYGQGMRLGLMARTDILPQLRVALRLGYTNYFDRSTIGTGLQQIARSHTSDLDVQLRWKF